LFPAVFGDAADRLPLNAAAVVVLPELLVVLTVLVLFMIPPPPLTPNDLLLETDTS
jgi:hypothetical protein